MGGKKKIYSDGDETGGGTSTYVSRKKGELHKRLKKFESAVPTRKRYRCEGKRKISVPSRRDRESDKAGRCISSQIGLGKKEVRPRRKGGKLLSMKILSRVFKSGERGEGKVEREKSSLEKFRLRESMGSRALREKRRVIGRKKHAAE